ncbi:MAG: D-alanyl-D-alanine carboxypeptidase (penicillin-binding protein 5/6) [Arenicella sp.]|jgi:D-alanyl-D-alanine carboxypeptidase (penicillin-binding protein 5/6)
MRNGLSNTSLIKPPCLTRLVGQSLCLLGFAFCNQAFGANDSVAENLTSSELAVSSSLPVPQVDAKAWILYEYNSGRVVAGLNGDLVYPPASITKLMTNYVVYGALQTGAISLTDQVTISEKSWRAEGSRMFAKVGSKVELQHLLKSTVIQSGNDAAIALAEHVAGSELAFAQRMNQAAAKLDLRHSRFVNSTGLPDPEHTMSAHDIATLSAAIIREYPDFYRWYSKKEYTHNEITQYNRNKLLWKDSTVDGLKTGHTNAAGYCLVGSALRGGDRWIAVVLGSSNERTREEAVSTLLNFAYAAYKPVRLLDQQRGLATAKVYFGVVDEVLLQAESQRDVVVPRGREGDVVVDLQYNPYYEAPIAVGQAMGVARLSLDGKSLAEVPIIAMSTINTSGLWKRVTDSVRLKWRESRQK